MASPLRTDRMDTLCSESLILLVPESLSNCPLNKQLINCIFQWNMGTFVGFYRQVHLTLDHWSRWWCIGKSGISPFGRWPLKVVTFAASSRWVQVFACRHRKNMKKISWTCSTRESFPWWSQKGPLFPRTSGALTHDAWPCIFLRVLCIKIWKNSCGEFQVPSFHLQLPWKWSVELSFFESFLKLKFENPCSLASMVLDVLGHTFHLLSALQFLTPSREFLLEVFNLRSSRLAPHVFQPEVYASNFHCLFAKQLSIPCQVVRHAAHIQPSTVFPLFLKVSWSVPRLCFLPVLKIQWWCFWFCFMLLSFTFSWCKGHVPQKGWYMIRLN